MTGIDPDVRRFLLPSLFLLAAGNGCRPLTARQETLIDGWLECTECTSGELDSVVAIGPAAVPRLRARLLDGPPPSRVANLRVERGRTYARLTRHGGPAGAIVGLPDSATYVGIYLANYRALYQVRSARALARIGGTGARAALDRALLLPLRPDVRLRIRLARESPWSP